MDVTLDFCTLVHHDPLRHQLNEELRSGFSRFRVVLMDDEKLRQFDLDSRASLSIPVDAGAES